MPAPTRLTYSADALVAANTEVLTLLDAGSTIKLWTNADVLIAEIPLDDPAGSVNGTTGILTLDIDGTDTALVTGVCTYATVEDSNDDAVVTIPVAEGNTPVAGFLVLNSATIVQGVTVSILSATIE